MFTQYEIGKGSFRIMEAYTCYANVDTFPEL